jgi:hypothetical protein
MEITNISSLDRTSFINQDYKPQDENLLNSLEINNEFGNPDDKIEMHIISPNGDIIESIRASMAIPTAFTPIEINNRLLVDGMMSRNFPVKDAKEENMDIWTIIDRRAGVITDRYLGRTLQDAISFKPEIYQPTSIETEDGIIEVSNLTRCSIEDCV